MRYADQVSGGTDDAHAAIIVIDETALAAEVDRVCGTLGNRLGRFCASQLGPNRAHRRRDDLEGALSLVLRDVTDRELARAVVDGLGGPLSIVRTERIKRGGANVRFQLELKPSWEKALHAIIAPVLRERHEELARCRAETQPGAKAKAEFQASA